MSGRHRFKSNAPSFPVSKTDRTVHPLKLVEKSLHIPSASSLIASELLDQARLWRSTGYVKKALDACRRALSFNISDPEIHYQLALNLIALQRYDDAIPVLEQALGLMPHNPSAQHLLNAMEGRSVCSTPVSYVNELFDRYSTTFDDRMNGGLIYQI